ncbi:MAG: NADH-quinone oxidoreductase subunit NuoE [candidate division NC10 bacterium]|nr:NADH-quinone oxidoreductase subunit NuoE [candidate division NC10 bacterium]
MKEKSQAILRRYPDKRSALLPILHLIQEEQGRLSDEAMVAVAELLGLKPVEVREVATFYTMFNFRPVGRYHIQVCHNLSCSLLGAESLIAHLEERLQIRAGETTPDNLFTLIKVECLGSCGTAPVMQINDDYYENLTKEKVDVILESLRVSPHG